MASKNISETLKQIANDQKYDMTKFIEESLSGFLTDLVNYFIHCTTKNQGFFKKKTAIDTKLIISAMQNIIVSLRLNLIKDDDYPKFASIFKYLLHPYSPVSFLSQTHNIFLSFMILIDKNYYDIFSSLFLYMVPVNKFSKTEEEKAIYEKEVLHGQISLFPRGEKNKENENPFSLIQNIYEFVSQRYQTKGELCKRLLYSALFPIIFKREAEDVKFPHYNYGLNDLVDEFYTMTFQFISSFNIDSNFLFSDEEKTKLFFVIIDDISKKKTIVPQKELIALLKRLFKKVNMIKQFLEGSNNNSVVFVNIIENALLPINSTQAEPEMVSEFLEFIEIFIKLFFDIFKDNLKDLINIFRYIFLLFLREQTYAYNMYFIFLVNLITSNNQNSLIWDFIVQIISQQEVYAAANARFSQYIALLQFPALFNINMEATLSEADIMNQRRKRNKIESEYDWFLDNIEGILKNPEKMVSNLDYFWKPKTNPELFLPDMKEIIIKYAPMIKFYFSLFDNYPKFSKTVEQIRVYSGLNAYFTVFLYLFKIPPSIPNDHSAFITECSNRLFFGCLNQNNIAIIKANFNILVKVMCLSEMKTLFGSDVLLKWYSTMIICLLIKDEELSELAFKAAEKTIVKGFCGSTIMIPILISYIENNCEISSLSFLASLPLFEVDIPNNTEFIKTIQSSIKNSNLFIDGVNNLLSKNGTNLKTRVYNLINKIVIKGKEMKLWTDLLPISSLIIVHEIIQEKPSEDLIIKYLNVIISAIKERSLEATLILHDLIITYKKSFIKIKQFYEFFLEIANLAIQPNDDPRFISYAIRLIGETLINFPDYAIKSNAIQNFALLLLKLHNTTPNELKIQISLLISKVSIYFKAYPYKYSPLCISSLVKPKNNKRTFLDKSNNVFHFEKENDTLAVDSYEQSYHFRWLFDEYKNQFKEGKVDQVNHPINNGAKEVPKSITQKENKEISDKFNSLVFNSMPNIDNKPSGLEHTLIESMNSFKNTRKDQEKSNVRPKHTYNIPSLISAIGYDIKNFKFIEPDSNEIKKYEYLNKNLTRFFSKIAIVYVSKGKRNQNEILSIDWNHTSSLFKEFLSGVGWNVELKNHHCYDGVLDRKTLSNGKSSIYYADESYEIMYHVGPLLKTDPKDEQQIYKKRHIGNDHIHIIWTEDDIDYDINTITSQFNCGHIVIYPLQTGLFRVDVFNKSDVEWFGPLRNSTVLTKKELPSLIRLTSINSMVRISESSTPLSVPPSRGLCQIHEINNSMSENPNIHVIIHSSNKEEND